MAMEMEMEGIAGYTFLVTGGLGFLGSALCLQLLRSGAASVTAFDLRTQSPFSDALRQRGVLIRQGDVGVKQDVEEAVRGADCVFHTASFGMSGKEMLQIGCVDRVNIVGTCHVLEACLRWGVPRLVYVSTYNVVFGGREILNGNEALPYFPIDLHPDAYARTKSLAEQLVLNADGRPFTSNKHRHGCVRTCAVRPAAIYGPGEERHLPRIVSMAKLGLLPFTIGDSSVKTDWIYIDNLVFALILASIALLDRQDSRRPPVAAGQAYFVSDGSPVNSFEFIGGLLRSLDYTLPTTSIAVPHALRIAKVFKGIYSVLYPWLDRPWLPHPFILPTEVYKVGVSHYFSILKAKRELGYVPTVTPRKGMGATIAYWQERKRKGMDGPSIFAWLFCFVGMTTLFCAAYLPDVGPIPYVRAIVLLFLRSMPIMRTVFLVAALLHVGEAAYAWHLASRVDPRNATAWFWQTLALGFFSLRFLLKRANNAHAP